MKPTTEQTTAAAKAMFPEAWPEGEEAMSPFQRGQLTMVKQNAIDRAQAGLEAVETGPVIEYPDDAIMVEQTLIVFSYLDKDGNLAVGIRTRGEGTLTNWLGMADVAKHYLLTTKASSFEQRGKED